MKLPVLLSHYKEHKASNKEITFPVFLTMHYFNGSPHDGTDMDLPFKTTAVALIIHNCPSAPVPPISRIPSIPAQELQINFSCHYTACTASGSTNDIFQPPQFS
jgi:hypothetical protein